VEGQDLGETAGDASSVIKSSSVQTVFRLFSPPKYSFCHLKKSFATVFIESLGLATPFETNNKTLRQIKK